MIFDFLLLPSQIMREVKNLQNLVINQTNKLEALMLNLDVLRSEIAENSDAVASAVTLISTLVEELRAAAGNQAEIDAIVNQLDAQTAALAAAVAANTPAAPAPAPVEPAPVVE
jgi:chromosome segregation ATPase